VSLFLFSSPFFSVELSLLLPLSTLHSFIPASQLIPFFQDPFLIALLTRLFSLNTPVRYPLASSLCNPIKHHQLPVMRYSTLATFVALLSSVATTELSLDSRGSDSSVVWAPSYSSDNSNSDNSYSGDNSWPKGSDSEDYSSTSADSYKSQDSTKTNDSYSHASKTGESYTKVTHVSKAYGDKNSTTTKTKTETKTGTHEVWSTHSVYKTKSSSGSDVSFPKYYTPCILLTCQDYHHQHLIQHRDLRRHRNKHCPSCRDRDSQGRYNISYHGLISNDNNREDKWHLSRSTDKHFNCTDNFHWSCHTFTHQPPIFFHSGRDTFINSTAAVRVIFGRYMSINIEGFMYVMCGLLLGVELLRHALGL